MQLRLARNKDGNQIINLIKRCFKDYKNCYLDVDNDSPELRNVYSYFKNKKGKFWVYVDKNKIIGCMGYLPHEKNNLEIHKLYICLLYTSPSPRDDELSRMPSSA